jgi:peptide/nickel transport system ATP-binding protein
MNAPAPNGSAASSAGDVLLEVDHLQVQFFTRRGTVQAVRDVSFTIRRGETLGLVGESGSGKSVTAQAILGLTELPGRITGGDVRWKGRSLVQGPQAADTLQRVRGHEMAMVFQDPMTSLNPVYTVGTQITEVLRRHLKMDRKAAQARAVDLLDLVGIANPSSRVKQYPHEMSGGMRQRVLIATALACEPELLIADEPTTALDVTIQAQILELIAELQERMGLAVLLITHDLGVVAGLCDRVAVMYGGKLVELAGATDLYHRPGHPYSAGLLRSTPRLDMVLDRLVSIDGAPPDLVNAPAGCPFAARCTLVVDRCRTEMPPLADHDGRSVACWRAFDPSLASLDGGAVTAERVPGAGGTGTGAGGAR